MLTPTFDGIVGGVVGGLLIGCAAGLLPGLFFGKWQRWLFVGVMFAGMWLHRVFAELLDSRPAQHA